MNSKAFILSLDATIAVILLIGTMFSHTSIAFKTPEVLSKIEKKQLIDDVFTAMDNSGFLLTTIDSNALTLEQKLEEIHSKALSLLPANFDLNIRLRQFYADIQNCRLEKSFEECFPDENVITKSYGNPIPESKNIVHGKRVFFRRQPPGDCQIGASFAEKEEEIKISERESIIFFQGEEPDANVFFDVKVSANELSCDQNLTVDLTVGIGVGGRKPIDVMLVIDRSGSMGWENPTRLSKAKEAATNFVSNLDEENDQSGLVSFAHNCLKLKCSFFCFIFTGCSSWCATCLQEEFATLDQELTFDHDLVDNAINELEAAGGTPIGEGLALANNELINGADVREESIKFEVLLTDGINNAGRNPLTEAQVSADNNIIVYTIGLGDQDDIDEDLLQDIAELTDGEYYYAEDANVLLQIFDLIGEDIAQRASDVNVYIPVMDGMQVVDAGTGTFSDGNLLFDINQVSLADPWEGSYKVNIPCDYAACDVNVIELFSVPGDAVLSYKDEAEQVHLVDWNVFATVDFKKRDLMIDFLAGNIIGPNYVLLDVNVANIADLDTNETMVRFRLNTEDGELLSNFIPLPETNPGDEYVFLDTPLNKEGVIWATINENQEDFADCSLNNQVMIICQADQPTYYYSLDYWMWSK